jgi:hypothetical protein
LEGILNEFFTAVTMKNAVFWNVAQCRSCVNRRFGGTYRLHLQGRKIRKRGTSASNLSGAKRRALQALKANEALTVLPANKGNASVVLRTSDYNRKIADLLENGLQLLAHIGSSFAIFFTLKMEAIISSETSVHTRTTRLRIQEDGIIQFLMSS